MGAVVSRERSHWGLRSSPWGHGACGVCTGIGAVVSCERNHWGPGRSSLWGHEAREVCVCVPKWVRWCHANATTGAFGGASHGATKRVRGVPTWER
eukprot:4570050-Pyramimonas_sp.AAC.1